MLSVFFMALSRFQAVIKPYQKFSFTQKKITITCIVFTWVIALVIASPYGMYMGIMDLCKLVPVWSTYYPKLDNQPFAMEKINNCCKDCILNNKTLPASPYLRTTHNITDVSIQSWLDLSFQSKTPQKMKNLIDVIYSCTRTGIFDKTASTVKICAYHSPPDDFFSENAVRFINFIIWLISALCVTIFYSMIAKELLRKNRNYKKGSVVNQTDSDNAAATVIIISCTYLICLLPWHLSFVFKDKLPNNKNGALVLSVVHCMKYANTG